jgi:hypothetical protein
MNERNTYDVLLNTALAEVGLWQKYFCLGEYDPRIDAHVIQAEIRAPKKLLGFNIPFTGEVSAVARIESEPRQARTQPQHQWSNLHYNGLRIQILHPTFTDKLRAVTQKLEKGLGEPVTLTA